MQEEQTTLTDEQLVLNLLWREMTDGRFGVPIGQFSQRTRMSNGQVHELLGKMQQDGLVKLQPKPGNTRGRPTIYVYSSYLLNAPAPVNDKYILLAASVDKDRPNPYIPDLGNFEPVEPRDVTKGTEMTNYSQQELDMLTIERFIVETSNRAYVMDNLEELLSKVSMPPVSRTQTDRVFNRIIRTYFPEYWSQMQLGRKGERGVFYFPDISDVNDHEGGEYLYGDSVQQALFHLAQRIKPEDLNKDSLVSNLSQGPNKGIRKMLDKCGGFWPVLPQSIGVSLWKHPEQGRTSFADELEARYPLSDPFRVAKMAVDHGNANVTPEELEVLYDIVGEPPEDLYAPGNPYGLPEYTD